MGKAVNKGIQKAGKAFSGLGNIPHEHEPAYNPYSQAELEEARYHGITPRQEESAGPPPERRPVLKPSRPAPTIPMVKRDMTYDEQQVANDSAEYFRHEPINTVKVPDLATIARMNTEARLGLHNPPPRQILRSMSDSEIEIEKARARYTREEPRFEKVVDHEAMRAQATLQRLQRRTSQLLKPPSANAMQDNMTMLLKHYNIVDITKFKPDQFVGMMIDLTAQTKYADATRDLIHDDNELGIKLQERWLNLRSLQINARKSNVHARSIKWLMENHTEAVIKYFGSGSDRAANKLLKLIKS